MVLVASVGLELRRRGDVEVNIHSSVLKSRRLGGLQNYFGYDGGDRVTNRPDFFRTILVLNFLYGIKWTLISDG
jgi:hypothetical protein